MKIKSKISKIINILIAGLITFQVKSYASVLRDPDPAYGVIRPEPKPEPAPNLLINSVQDFFRVFLIPIIILLVGIIIYLIKGKSNILRKIINILVVIVILLCLFFLIRFIIIKTI